MDVVIPAGGAISSEFAARIGTPCRALAPLGPGGRPAMQLVVDALRGSGGVSQVIGVAPPAVAEVITGVDRWLPSGESGPANVLRGLAAAAPDRPALVCASDLPLLTPESVREFLVRCRPEADISVGLVSAGAYHRAFPDAPPSRFVPLRDAGPVTIGGLYRLRPELLARRRDRYERLFGARKSQWRMAALLGPRLLWQWATRSLSLDTLIARAEAQIQARVDILRDAAPVLSFDIDTVDDYAYAHTCLERRVASLVR